MPSSVLGYETERCNRWTINPLADSVALSCPRCYAKAPARTRDVELRRR